MEHSAPFRVANPIIGLVLLLQAGPGCAPNVEGLQQHVVNLEGRTRTYELHVPQGLGSSRPVPLLVALHRLYADGNDMAYMSGFNEVADRESFIVVYPDGPGGQWTFGGGFETDVKLVLAVIEDVAAEHAIDRDRVYLTGASNGGFMTYVLACAETETFTAAAPVMGLMRAALAEESSPAPPLPILIIHGTRDGIVPYNATTFMFKETLSVDKAVAYWVQRNGCDPRPEVEELADRDPDDGTRVTLERYGGGEAPVVLCRVEGGGHTWPGGKEPGLGLTTGPLSRDVAASELIWQFFTESTESSFTEVRR